VRLEGGVGPPLEGLPVDLLVERVEQAAAVRVAAAGRP
jgi:hypothetical protein